MTSQWKSCHAGRMTAKRLLPSATQRVFNLAGQPNILLGISGRSLAESRGGLGSLCIHPRAHHPPGLSPPAAGGAPWRGGSSVVCSVLRNVQEPAGSRGGDWARMKRPGGAQRASSPAGRQQAHSRFGNPTPGRGDLPIAVPWGAQSGGGEKERGRNGEK